MGGSRIIGGIEIGTHKVVVLIGEVTGSRGLTIIGKGEGSSRGVRKGRIVDFHKACACAHAVIEAAEKSAGVQVDSLYMSQTGAHLQGFSHRGTTAVSSPDGIVGRADVERAVENARTRDLPEGRVYLHHIRTGFRLDQKPVEDPVGLRGENLDAGYWHVHGDEREVADALQIAAHFGVRVQDFIVSSIASANMVASEAERSAGILVIDIGRGTTDYVLYRNGHIARSGVIPVGGDHLTNDLACALRVPLKEAERIKIEEGAAVVDPGAKKERVWLFGDVAKGNSAIGNRNLPRSSIQAVLQARCEETLRFVKKACALESGSRDLPAGVVLTGGTARLPGIADLTSQVFEVDARVGANPDWARDELRDPAYSTVLGLLYFGLFANASEDEEVRERKATPPALIKRMISAFSRS